MIFNSIEFAVFCPIVFAIYWILRKQLRWQNAFILVASYVFYGWWSWRFLLLIAFTSACSYLSGLLIGRHGSGTSLKKAALWGNIIVNIGILWVFKYYDFFSYELAEMLGLNGNKFMLHLALPVGISFYTFQALSYSIDVYKGKIAPTRDVIAFFAFIAFFPQLVAGPIERATNLLPQFLQKREFNYNTAVDGCWQILWGLFKKMVVADNCAEYVNVVFDEGGGPGTLVLAAMLFTFQIYGDFSGYSDIAIGTAKLFGIRLTQNFRTPYFSRDIAEFWRRWHISLTTWFRDYIYIPLGGSRVKKWKVVRNTFIIFLVSGLWHGANWTFIVWGLYHACLFMPLVLLGKNRKHTDAIAAGRLWPRWSEVGQMALTFILVVIGWIVFRANDIMDALRFFERMFDIRALSAVYKFFVAPDFTVSRWAIILLLVIEWINRNEGHGLGRLPSWCTKRIGVLFFVISIILVLFFRGGYSEFIYFQF